MVCRLNWIQNIGHVGDEIVVCAVHGHHDHMKSKRGARTYKLIWGDLARMINEHKVKFLAGDWNMALP